MTNAALLAIMLMGDVMIIYKDILKQLSEAGWSTYRLQKERVLPNSVIIAIRAGRSITVHSIDTICGLLNCQPNDIMVYVPDKQGE